MYIFESFFIFLFEITCILVLLHVSLWYANGNYTDTKNEKSKMKKVKMAGDSKKKTRQLVKDAKKASKRDARKSILEEIQDTYPTETNFFGWVIK